MSSAESPEVSSVTPEPGRLLRKASEIEDPDEATSRRAQPSKYSGLRDLQKQKEKWSNLLRWVLIRSFLSPGRPARRAPVRTPAGRLDDPSRAAPVHGHVHRVAPLPVPVGASRRRLLRPGGTAAAPCSGVRPALAGAQRGDSRKPLRTDPVFPDPGVGQHPPGPPPTPPAEGRTAPALSPPAPPASSGRRCSSRTPPPGTLPRGARRSEHHLQRSPLAVPAVTPSRRRAAAAGEPAGVTS